MLGLKRGTVKLYDHETAWEIEAQQTITRLKQILGGVIIEIQHVGSTSIPAIKAKPIIDIALAVDNFNDILAYEQKLKEFGFYYRPGKEASLANQLLFACGSNYDGTGEMQTHFIHVVRTGSKEWQDYINFRDYLIATPSAAKAYEDLKVSLAAAAPVDSGREKYLRGKHDFVVDTLKKAAEWSSSRKTAESRLSKYICRAKAILICGKICSGKTTYARQLCAQNRAVLLSVDEIMLDLFGQHSGEKHDEYAKRTQDYLFEKSLQLLEKDMNVVLDWGFWTQEGRSCARKFYTDRGIDCEIHYIDINDKAWRLRIEKRNRDVSDKKTNAYYIDENLAAKFDSRFEKPNKDEIDIWIKEQT